LLVYLNIIFIPCVIYILLAIVLVPLGLAFLTELFRTSYTVGPDGCRVQRWGRWRGYPWEEVTAIWLLTTVTYHEATQSTAQCHSCRLRFADRSRLTIAGLNEEFLHWVEQQVYRTLLPRIMAEWDAGQPVDFGTVSLSRAGIHFWGNLLSWS